MPAEKKIAASAQVIDRLSLLEELYKQLVKAAPPYALLAESFIQPDPGAQVEITPVSTDWLQVGQLIQVWDPETGRGGYYIIDLVGDDTILGTLQAYQYNTSAADIVIPVASRVIISSGQPDYAVIYDTITSGRIKQYSLSPAPTPVDWVTISFAANAHVHVSLFISSDDGFARLYEFMLTKATGIDAFSQITENHDLGVNTSEEITIESVESENSIKFQLVGTGLTTTRTVKTKFAMNTPSLAEVSYELHDA